MAVNAIGARRSGFHYDSALSTLQFSTKYTVLMSTR